MLLTLEQIISDFRERTFGISEDSERQPILSETNEYGNGQEGPESEPNAVANHQQNATIRVLALILALTIHSIFEGIAIGVQTTTESVLQVGTQLSFNLIYRFPNSYKNIALQLFAIAGVFIINPFSRNAGDESDFLVLFTNPCQVLTMFTVYFQITGALTIHKIVIAFSLGLTLSQSPLGMLKSILCGLIFAAASPLGVGIGLVVTTLESLDGSLVVGVLQGLAAGSFLYVTFLEVLPHEFRSGHLHLPKLGSFILGFSVICLALLLFPDN